jgi:hypothetical protein
MLRHDSIPLAYADFLSRCHYYFQAEMPFQPALRRAAIIFAFFGFSALLTLFIADISAIAAFIADMSRCFDITLSLPHAISFSSLASHFQLTFSPLFSHWPPRIILAFITLSPLIFADDITLSLADDFRFHFVSSFSPFILTPPGLIDD